MKGFPGRKNKYHARKTIADGIVFDSAAESRRWMELKMLQRAGMITGLTRQVPFELVPSQKGAKETYRPVTYRADFVYYEDGKMVVEDVKGCKTDVYEIKKKLMLFLRGIEIREV